MKGKAKAGSIILIVFGLIALAVILTVSLLVQKDAETESTAEQTQAQTVTGTSQATEPPTEAPTELPPTVFQTDPPVENGTIDMEALYVTDDDGNKYIPFYEDYLPFDYYIEGRAKNNGEHTVTVEGAYGPVTVTVGMKLDFSKGIILNPVCSEEGRESLIGYFVVADNESILYDKVQPVKRYGDWALDDHVYSTYFMETYDQAVPVQYMDERAFGIAWAPEGPTASDVDYVSLRVVNISKNRVIAIIGVKIEKVNGLYQITDVFDRTEKDTVLVQTLSDMAREALANSDTTTMPYQNFADTPVLVEKREKKMYVTQYLDPAYHKMAGSALVRYPVYAVTLNTDNPSFGYMTYYFAPAGIYKPGDTPHVFELVGYEPYILWSQETVRKFSTW